MRWVLVFCVAALMGCSFREPEPPVTTADDLVVSARLHKPHGKRNRSSPGVIDTFEEAHKALPKIFGPESRTLYCGCLVRGNKVDLASCGYKVSKDARRAARREWEHVVPAHAFGQSFIEWREGSPACPRKGKKSRGRSCARKNHDFNLMESDLYNLWPEVGELNGLRNNFSMAEISGRFKTFGRCTAKIADKKFEPMDMAKGTVARVYMYMEWKYPGHGIISEKNRPLFEAWDRQHPVTDYECSIGTKVHAMQGNANPVLASRCKGFPAGGAGPLVMGAGSAAGVTGAGASPVPVSSRSPSPSPSSSVPAGIRATATPALSTPDLEPENGDRRVSASDEDESSSQSN